MFLQFFLCRMFGNTTNYIVKKNKINRICMEFSYFEFQFVGPY